jgi:hypothetical protein
VRTRVLFFTLGCWVLTFILRTACAFILVLHTTSATTPAQPWATNALNANPTASPRKHPRQCIRLPSTFWQYWQYLLGCHLLWHHCRYHRATITTDITSDIAYDIIFAITYDTTFESPPTSPWTPPSTSPSTSPPSPSTSPSTSAIWGR